MKRLLLIILAVLALAGREACAQDYIYTAKGQVIEATDVIFGPSKISYHLYSDAVGPMLSIDTSDVKMIMYENGEKLDLRPRKGQPTPGLKYPDIKDYYNYKEYVREQGDPYNPPLLGLASFLLPGLGQIIEDEWFTGLLFFGGSLAMDYVTLSTIKTSYDVTGEDESQVIVKTLNVSWGTVIALAGSIALRAFAASDAVKIAKVKNMYIKDMQLQPNLSYVPGTAAPAPGLSLRLYF